MSSALNEVLYGKITRLSHTWRYSAQPVLVRENVAEHSFWTAMIGVTIAYETHYPQLAGSVALHAIVHDIEECMTGDLIRDMKYASDEFRQAIQNIEEEFVGRLVDKMGQTGQIFQNRWRSAKDESVAGRIVAVADALSVIAYCTREQTLGNQNLSEIRGACMKLVRHTAEGTFMEDIVEDALETSGNVLAELTF